MALLMVSPGRYENPSAITNNIKYITRTRVDEKRRSDLVSYGAIGASVNPILAIEQFKKVQLHYKGTKYIGKRIFHETLLLDEDDLTMLNYDVRHIHAYAERCAYFYYCHGFQVMFAVHWDQEKKFHIHFVGNAVCYLDGHKWVDSYDHTRENHHRYCLWWYYKTHVEPTCQVIQPISFDNGFQVLLHNFVVGERKFYVVANGKKCGIYEDYYDCQSQVENYPNDSWKICYSLGAAYDYLIQNLEIRDYYEIKLHGFSWWFQEYHSFLDFLNLFKDRYNLISLA